MRTNKRLCWAAAAAAGDESFVRVRQCPLLLLFSFFSSRSQYLQTPSQDWMGNNCALQTSLFKPPGPAPLCFLTAVLRLRGPSQSAQSNVRDCKWYHSAPMAAELRPNLVPSTLSLVRSAPSGSPLIGWLFIALYINCWCAQLHCLFLWALGLTTGSACEPTTDSHCSCMWKTWETVLWYSMKKKNSKQNLIWCEQWTMFRKVTKNCNKNNIGCEVNAKLVTGVNECEWPSPLCGKSLNWPRIDFSSTSTTD